MSIEDLVNRRVEAVISPARKYVGTILSVKNDYIILDDENDGIAMLSLHHAKHLRDSPDPTDKSRRTKKHLRSTPEDDTPEEFSQLIRTFKHTVVQLDGGNPTPTIGYVMEVMEDYLSVVVIPDGLVYFPISHIQALIPVKASMRLEFVEWAKRYCHNTSRLSKKLVEVLNQQAGNLVRLGRGGPDCICGILRYADHDWVELVTSPHETIYIPMHHVKEFSNYHTFEWEVNQPENESNE